MRCLHRTTLTTRKTHTHTHRQAHDTIHYTNADANTCIRVFTYTIFSSVRAHSHGSGGCPCSKAKNGIEKRVCGGGRGGHKTAAHGGGASSVALNLTAQACGSLFLPPFASDLLLPFSKHRAKTFTYGKGYLGPGRDPSREGQLRVMTLNN